MLPLAIAVLLAAGAPAPAPASGVAAPPPDAAAPVEPRPDADAGARYDAAMALLLDGRLLDAAAAFDAVAADPRAGALGERARTLAEVSRALAARGRFVPESPRLAEPRLERPRPGRLDRGGRAELALFATTYGIWSGVATGVLADFDDVRAYLGLGIAGGAAGLALAILPTRDRPMPAGRAQAIESAATWGSFNGLMLSFLADVEDGRTATGTTLGAGAAALASAVLLTRDRSPSSGDVALTNSGGIWGLVAGALVLTLQDDPTDTTVQGVLLGAADAGLLAMGAAARRLELTRGRSLVIDAGGVLGTLVGLSIPAFAESDDGTAYGISGLAGMAAGLGTAAYLTRGWDADEAESGRAATPALFPAIASRPGGGFTAGIAGAF